MFRAPHQSVSRIGVDGPCGLAVCGDGTPWAQDGATGVTVVLDGELESADTMVGGERGARRVLELYLREGCLFDPPDGQFAAVIWDPRASSLILVMDRLGTRPLFVAEAAGSIVVASELKALVAAGLEPRLDPQGWAEILAFEHTLGESTPLLGVRLLPSATTTTIEADGRVTVRNRGRYRLDPDRDGELMGLVDEFAMLLEQAVERRGDERVGLALSGGLDSRCMAAAAISAGRAMPAFTFGMHRSEEHRRAAAVAGALGVDHHVIELERGFLARSAEEVVWRSEGRIRCLHAHHLALGDLRERFGLRRLLTGYAGDAVARSAAPGQARPAAELVDAIRERSTVAVDDEMAHVLLTPEFADDLRGRTRPGVEQALDVDRPNDVARGQFMIEQVYRNKVLPGVQLFSDELVSRDPYTDAALLDFLARVPTSLRVGGELQRAYLRRIPALARIPNPKDGIPPALTGVRKELARQKVRARRSVAVRLAGPVRQVGRPPRSGLGDYTGDLRAVGGASLLGILLEERTIDRGQLRADAVRSLVDATLAGQVANTKAVGVLLTLELFQRQFVDGDRFRSSDDDQGSHARRAPAPTRPRHPAPHH